MAPSVHVPEVARPLASLVSTAAARLPALALKFTMTPLTGRPFSSVTLTVGAAGVAVATAALLASPAVFWSCEGTGGDVESPPPQAASASARAGSTRAVTWARERARERARRSVTWDKADLRRTRQAFVNSYVSTDWRRRHGVTVPGSHTSRGADFALS